MEDKKKGNLSTLLIILLIIIIGVMAYYMYISNNEKTENIAVLKNEINNLKDAINTLEQNNNLSDSENSNENINDLDNPNEDENSIDYVEMTEENYKRYSSNGYRFEIFDMIKKLDDTVIISGRVYKLIELPILTEEQYQDLLDGNTVSILDYEMKINNNEDAAGHDFVIESITDDWMKYYVNKKEDGTAELFQSTEISEYCGTDIYMQITVEDSIATESGLGDITLEEYLEHWEGGIELDDIEMFPNLATEFVFENGKCNLIRFTSV